MEFSQIIALLEKGLKESLGMLVSTTFLAYLFGLPLGVLLYNTSQHGLKPNKWVYKVISFIVNILRSVPFLILMVFLIPFTRFVAGTSIGSKAAVVPLFIASAPFVARLVEASLREIPLGIIDAARSMGASNFNILFHVLLSEARISILSGSVIASVTILSYSALAGFVGGGGLGALAINYGYNRYDDQVMFWTVLVIVLLVQIIEAIGRFVIRKLEARKGA